MSQVTEQSVRFQTALASIKLIQASAVLDLTEDDFDFLTSNKVWIATDRSRARRCVEACVYGTLDFVGYPRFPAPVEFIAAVIAYYVHPVNIQTACLIMEGAEFTENIINGVERPVKAAELFSMQGVEFDNGDMYVDGRKAASDVRDEFVSVTEKLMDELAQCYNVLPQLDINNTIDYRPEGDEKWFLENEKTVTQFCRKLAAERPLKDIRDEYNYPIKKGIKDECSRLLEASTMKSRRGFAIQRFMNAMRQAHADGWFIVFDTLTLADDRLEAFYDNPNALRDYFRDIGRMVLAAEGRKANDSHADCYQYFCVPEYGTANGRLHFHAVHFMRTLPTGSVDPNFGRRVRNRRQLNSLQNTWPYGYSM